ncbi:MAG: hypothetical protein NXH97_06595 [Rhodobacteraceae bacterium]|nr:hypothetical protein [Paracoccaceae bacterium]
MRPVYVVVDLAFVDPLTASVMEWKSPGRHRLSDRWRDTGNSTRMLPQRTPDPGDAIKLIDHMKPATLDFAERETALSGTSRQKLFSGS